jgi:hypothetical protein
MAQRLNSAHAVEVLGECMLQHGASEPGSGNEL